MTFRARVQVAGYLAMAISGGVQAAIDDDNSSLLGGGDGGGELFLSVIDRDAAQPMSYVLNLGVSVDQFLANDASFVKGLSFKADAKLRQLLANPGGRVAWNIAAVRNDFGPAGDSFGYLTSAPGSLVANTDTLAGYFDLYGSITVAGMYLEAVNASMGDDTSVLVSDPLSTAFHDGRVWGNIWHGGAHLTEGALDESLGFYFVATDAAPDGTMSTSRAPAFLGHWILASDGSLTYGAAVPIPAAFGLFGSALLGLAAVARRRFA